MDEFIHKTVSDAIQLERENALSIEWECSHTRTSKGFASIVLRVDRSAVLTISNDTYGPGYEQVAREIAELLLRVANNPCNLPVK